MVWKHNTVSGTDGKPRCGWASADPLYQKYHDTEWGRPLKDDRALFELMVQEVVVHAAPFTSMHGHAVDGAHMLGTSGTVTTIAGIHLNLPRYDRRRVDGCWLSETEVTRVIDRLQAERSPERRTAIADLAGKISDIEMRKMNYEVDGEHRDTADVARDFLHQNGIG